MVQVHPEVAGRSGMKLPASETALLLIAHGSREPAANADLHYLASQLRQRGPYGIVEASFLELAEPTIAQAAEICLQKGAKHVILMPHFLSAGVHVNRDLTEAERELSERHPEARFVLAEPIGRHPLLVNIVLERAGLANGEPE
jgi:sirohydrochlorin ferrochelatase